VSSRPNEEISYVEIYFNVGDPSATLGITQESAIADDSSINLPDG
jgi:hypothetical protein